MQNSNYNMPRRRKKKVKIKYKNVAIALALLVLLLYAMVSCTVSVFNKNKDDKDKQKAETSQSQSDSSNDNNKDNSKIDVSNTNSKDKEANASNSEVPKDKVPPEQVLNNAAFIGDSRMKGLVLYNGLTSIKDYTDIGLNVETAMNKAFIPSPDGNAITIQQALSSVGEIERIYISLGINELGWPSVDGFIGKYTELINMVKQTQPKAKIYVLAILPVTKERSDSDATFNNTKINDVNKQIEKMAKDLGVTYLDCKSAVSDQSGSLVADASTDGIHLTKAYCEKWLQFIKENP